MQTQRNPDDSVLEETVGASVSGGRPMRILLLNVPEIYSEGVESRLHHIGGDITVTRTTKRNNYQELLAAGRFDLVVADTESPSLEDIQELSDSARSTATRLVVIVSTESESLRQCLSQLQVSGLVWRSETAEVLQKIVCAVLAQWTPTSKEMLVAERRARCEGLTLRQLEVLEALSEGKSNKRIGQKLSITEHTVKAHLKAVFRVLGVSSRIEAVRIAWRSGLVIDRPKGIQGNYERLQYVRNGRHEMHQV